MQMPLLETTSIAVAREPAPAHDLPAASTSQPIEPVVAAQPGPSSPAVSPARRVNDEPTPFARCSPTDSTNSPAPVVSTHAAPSGCSTLAFLGRFKQPETPSLVDVDARSEFPVVGPLIAGRLDLHLAMRFWYDEYQRRLTRQRPPGRF